MAALKGSCLCGAVRFAVDGKVSDVVACHCSICRKHSGHYWAASRATKSDFSVVGAEYVRWYKSSGSARRGFCELCGSTLFWEEAGSDKLSFSAGSVDGETGLRLAAHIFVADKGDYYHIGDGAKQFEASDGSAKKGGE